MPGGNDDENVFVLNLLLGGPISIERTFLIAESLYINLLTTLILSPNNSTSKITYDAFPGFSEKILTRKSACSFGLKVEGIMT